MSSQAVTRWHTLLRALALLNLLLWSLCTLVIATQGSDGHRASAAALHLQVVLSAAYVLGCAFRSVLPVYDIPRIVLIDSRLSSVAIGRSVATVAELCFAAQWALMLHQLTLLSGSGLAAAVSVAIVPLVLLAEGFSWYAVLTTRQRAHVVENSIWGLSAALVVASLWAIGPHRFAYLSLAMIGWCVGGVAYAAFIFFYDVPMYWSRSSRDRAEGRQALSIAQGLRDICRRGVVSYRWEDWKSEVLWMSLYFSVGVWGSLSLVYASGGVAAPPGS